MLNRDHYPALNEWVHLNQASLGLIGQPAVETMHHFLDKVARHGNLNMTDDEEVAFFDSLRERQSLLPSRRLSSRLRPEAVASLNPRCPIYR